MILQPNGAPSTRVVETLSREEVKRLIEFEQWTTARGLALDIYCRKCVDTHGPGGRCWANNARDASTYRLECQHCERVYGNANTPRREVAPEPEKKIQVSVH